ncbi:MAG: hypothetical protein U0841_23505 [Chloroflexia bacterium]
MGASRSMRGSCARSATRPTKAYPLVRIIHGGPHSIFGHVFFFDMQAWANQGWHVIFINPRASQRR